MSSPGDPFEKRPRKKVVTRCSSVANATYTWSHLNVFGNRTPVTWTSYVPFLDDVLAACHTVGETPRSSVTVTPGERKRRPTYSIDSTHSAGSAGTYQMGRALPGTHAPSVITFTPSTEQYNHNHHQQPIHPRTKQPHLLRNVSGVAHAGELLAILGSSGSGKTTLLNTLAFRSGGDVRVANGSKRLVNGHPVMASAMRPYCGYVEQADMFLGTLTAAEHLFYQAQLRLGKEWTQRMRAQRVDEVMSELSLKRCADTLIGEPGKTKGLSGGERKRLAFATETLSNPLLLLCDEPTSGLDSFMSLSVLQVLKRLAAKGKTVIVTIHQPSSELVAMFDRMLFLAAGRVAFWGTRVEGLEFFAKVGQPCPEGFSATDHFVQVLGVSPNREAEDRPRIELICDAFAESALGMEMMEAVRTGGFGSDVDADRRVSQVINDVLRKSRQLEGLMVDGSISAKRQKVLKRRRYEAGWWRQFSVLYRRTTRSLVKEKLLFRVRLITTVVIALMIGGIFLFQRVDSDGVMNMNGAMFLVLITMTYQNLFSVIDVFCNEMPVFLRESHRYLYRTSVYFMAKSLAELPIFVLTPVIFMAIVYPLVGYVQDTEAMLHAFGMVVLVSNVAASFSYFASCASPSLSVALSVAPPVTVPVMLFSGYYLNLRSVPRSLRWCPYLSWLRYGMEGWMIVQWRDIGTIECVGGMGNTSCLSSGAQVLQYYEYPEDNLWLDYAGLGALFVVFRLAAYATLVCRQASVE